jgi:glucosylceramidase
MSNAQTRRTFLKLSAVGMTATAIADLGPGLTASVPAPRADIAVRVTSGKLRYAKADNLTWRDAGAAGDSAIVLDPTKKFQEMLGFGAAFTDAACYMFNQLAAPAREALFHELFHPSEMA